MPKCESVGDQHVGVAVNVGDGEHLMQMSVATSFVCGDIAKYMFNVNIIAILSYIAQIRFFTYARTKMRSQVTGPCASVFIEFVMHPFIVIVSSDSQTR